MTHCGEPLNIFNDYPQLSATLLLIHVLIKGQLKTSSQPPVAKTGQAFSKGEGTRRWKRKRVYFDFIFSAPGC